MGTRGVGCTCEVSSEKSEQVFCQVPTDDFDMVRKRKTAMSVVPNAVEASELI